MQRVFGVAIFCRVVFGLIYTAPRHSALNSDQPSQSTKIAQTLPALTKSAAFDMIAPGDIPLGEKAAQDVERAYAVVGSSDETANLILASTMNQMPSSADVPSFCGKNKKLGN